MTRDTMRAARVTRYGPPEVIELVDLPRPVPKPGELLVRVLASPVTTGDMRLRSARVPRGLGLLVRLAIGWSGPRHPVPGWGFVGEVAGGEGVPMGTRVIGVAGFRGGAHADYLTIRADGPVRPLPDGLTPEEGASLLFGGLTAAHAVLDWAGVAPGDRVWVNGATGSVGAMAVQIAAAKGGLVTASASPARHPLARDLGAVALQDYRDGPPAGPFDVVIDVFGSAPYAGAKAVMADGARHIALTADLPEMLGATLRRVERGHRRFTGTTSESRAALDCLLALVADGTVRPLVGEVFPLDRIRDAHRLVETMSKPGSVVLRIGPDQTPA